MLYQILTCLVLAGAPVFVQAQDTASWGYSTRSSQSCTILSGSGGTPSYDIPTRGIDQQFTITVTSSAITTPSTIVVTASTTVTVTDRTFIDRLDTFEIVTSPTLVRGARTRYVVGIATWLLTVCTNGIKPKTETVYTGTYKPMSGQVTTIPKVYPTEVLCSGGQTTIWIKYPFVTSGVVTSTVTPSVRIQNYSESR